MPNKSFLESYDLYRRFPLELPETFREMQRPAINMRCLQCESEQTFNMLGGYADHLTPPYTQVGTRFGKEIAPTGMVVKLEYLCAACDWKRSFLVGFDPEGHYVEKVGQFPAPDISIDPRVEKVLEAENVKFYKNGRICEAQGYGIGAFAYYRRLLESVISRLLKEVVELVPEAEKKTYLAGLEKVKEAKNAEEKIQVAKDLLPETLKSKGVNPLSTLYGALSEKLHQESDSDCLEIAVEIRTLFDALVIQIEANKATAKALAESTKKLLRDKLRASGP